MGYVRICKNVEEYGNMLALEQGSATFINQRAIFDPKKRTETVQEPHNIFEAYNEGNTAYLLSLN